MSDFASERPALVIDASGSSVFVGLLQDQQWLANERVQAPALEGLFIAVDQVLADANSSLDQIQAYIYSEGPGSVLGLRLCSMAIETWSRLYPQSANRYAYNSLQLTARLIRIDQPDADNALIVADWKKGAWNAVKIQGGSIGDTEVVDDDTLNNWSDALFHQPQRKGWQAPPSGATTVNYSPERLPKVISSTKLLRPTEGVELYNAGVNTFQKWTAERHRANT
ncbi:MAG: hypothetical protein ACPGJU_04880 [Coraliomargarita sp.]